MSHLDIIPAQDTPAYTVDPKRLPALKLAGVTSRFVETQALIFHVLESVPKNVSGSRPPLILCVHGFPELAYSWRYILPLLAAKGYYAVAFDQRGYGRTHPADLKPIPGHTFRPLSLMKDTIALVHALGCSHIHTLVGHDFGAVTAAYLALQRGGPQDFVRSLVLMSHPYKGVPQIPFNTSPAPALSSMDPTPTPSLPQSPYDSTDDPDIHSSLASLPTPRKHYKWYYCTRPSADEMTNPTGPPLHTFLRGYFHLKSADWTHHHDTHIPNKLRSWTAPELERMPHYYIMPLHSNMREAVAHDMQDQPVSTYGYSWLSDEDLQFFTDEYARTTFGPPMNWYRIQTSPEAASDSVILVGKRFNVPMKFVAGKQDWGTYQEPGALEAMESGRSVEDGYYLGTVLIEGAGHWVNQEKPEDCVNQILDVASHVKN